jgi:hypothetical protein
MLAALERRELVRSAAQLAAEMGKGFAEAATGDRVDGRLVRKIALHSGSYGVVERTRDFTLVPWRAVLEPHVGKPVAGIMRDNGVSWTLGRQRSGPSLS